jgi:hypothetical protein
VIVWGGGGRGAEELRCSEHTSLNELFCSYGERTTEGNSMTGYVYGSILSPSEASVDMLECYFEDGQPMGAPRSSFQHRSGRFLVSAVVIASEYMLGVLCSEYTMYERICLLCPIRSRHLLRT